MLSRNVSERLRVDGMRQQERGRGRAVSLLRFSSNNAAEGQIPSVSHLPIADGDEEVTVQNLDGSLVYIEGWSAPPVQQGG